MKILLNGPSIKLLAIVALIVTAMSSFTGPFLNGIEKFFQQSAVSMWEKSWNDTLKMLSTRERNREEITTDIEELLTDFNSYNRSRVLVRKALQKQCAPEDENKTCLKLVNLDLSQRLDYKFAARYKNLLNSKNKETIIRNPLVADGYSLKLLIDDPSLLERWKKAWMTKAEILFRSQSIDVSFERDLFGFQFSSPGRFSLATTDVMNVFIFLTGSKPQCQQCSTLQLSDNMYLTYPLDTVERTALSWS